MEEQEREYTRKDFEVVIERYLYSKTLTDKDKHVLENLPFCMCTAFEENPALKERYDKHLRNLAMSGNTLDLNGELPNYLMIDIENEGEWYHPEFGGLLPSLENPGFVTIFDADNKKYVVEGTIGNVERTLLKNGYRYIRHHNYNGRVVYFKD